METINIKGKDYVTVNERIKYFRSNEKYAGWSLLSEIMTLENGICTIKASIIDDSGKLMATGHAQEKDGSSFINNTSYIENCETSAWGRALGNLGIGIDVSIASYEEVANSSINQNYKEAKKNLDKEIKEVQQANKGDKHIYTGLENCETLAECNTYLIDNKNSVEDVEKFRQAYQKKCKQLRGE